MVTRLDIPHTQNIKEWNQEEIEEHESALMGDNVCYYCLAKKVKENKEENSDE